MTGGNITISIKYSFLPPFPHILNLCDLAEISGSKCPLAAGQHTFTLKEEVSSILPSVSVC